MQFSYLELKDAVYKMMAVLGIVFLLMSLLPFTAGVTQVTHLASSICLFLAGIVFLLFSLTTFLIRDDPDVWR